MEFRRNARFTTRETVKDALETALREIEKFPGKEQFEFSISIEEKETSPDKYGAVQLANASVNIAYLLPSFAEGFEEKSKVNAFVKAYNQYSGLRMPEVICKPKK